MMPVKIEGENGTVEMKVPAELLERMAREGGGLAAVSTDDGLLLTTLDHARYLEQRALGMEFLADYAETFRDLAK